VWVLRVAAALIPEELLALAATSLPQECSSLIALLSANRNALAEDYSKHRNPSKGNRTVAAVSPGAADDTGVAPARLDQDVAAS
jgi:hypothetical protein